MRCSPLDTQHTSAGDVDLMSRGCCEWRRKTEDWNVGEFNWPARCGERTPWQSRRSWTRCWRPCTLDQVAGSSLCRTCRYTSDVKSWSWSWSWSYLGFDIGLICHCLGLDRSWSWSIVVSGLGLGLVFFGLGLGFGLELCGLVNITAYTPHNHQSARWHQY